MNFRFQNTYTKLPKTYFTPTLPTPVKSPKLVLFNSQLAEELGLEESSSNTEEMVAYFSGNKPPEGAFPIAQAYAGHQFGHFTMLGDGRAILMGEHLTPSGKRFDIQWKGSGKTVYSRRGDGRATLRAMLREYLISESMRGLGVPSSGSLAIVLTGETIYREKHEPSAILTRTMQSHIRVGTFEYASYFLSNEELLQLTNYTIERHYPSLIHEENRALALLEAVSEKQLKLIVEWMRVGFIHGVMNTDNMSIAGETFDYGPCAFMNAYHPQTVFSSIDTQGRYAFAQQPNIAHWNLSRFAETLLPLIHPEQKEAIHLAEEVLQTFIQKFEAAWLAMMEKKIGVNQPAENTDNQPPTPVYKLLKWMEVNRADYTSTFLQLHRPNEQHTGIYATPAFKDWLLLWRQWLKDRNTSENEARATMLTTNPTFIPRNNWVEKALDDACTSFNFSLFHELLQAMRTPYSEHTELLHLQTYPENDSHYVTYCGT